MTGFLPLSQLSEMKKYLQICSVYLKKLRVKIPVTNCWYPNPQRAKMNSKKLSSRVKIST
jgi:hypothetical protein